MLMMTRAAGGGSWWRGLSRRSPAGFGGALAGQGYAGDTITDHVVPAEVGK